MSRQSSKPDPSLTENSKKDLTDFSENWVNLLAIYSRSQEEIKNGKGLKTELWRPCILPCSAHRQWVAFLPAETTAQFTFAE